MDTSGLLAAVQEIDKRAERVGEVHVTETYVSAGSLIDALSSYDNGVIFGRRGTGKTHALRYLAGQRKAEGDLVILIDMEQDLGSTESIYGDSGLSPTYRATRLLIDILGIIHEKFLEDAFLAGNSSAIDALDKMMDHFNEVIVADEAEAQAIETDEVRREGGSRLGIEFSKSPFSYDRSKTRQAALTSESATTVKGVVRPRVHFGAVRELMNRCVSSQPDRRRIWLLFDEWSGLPRELQPFVAEMLRKLFFGIPRVTTRLAAIPHRSEWRITRDDGSYIGVEIGSEIFALLDLDEFVVFPARSKSERAKRSSDFFRELLFRHVNYVLGLAGKQLVRSSDQLIKLLFTQVTSFQEMIRAAEGVPRDALLILGRAALRAGSARISTDHVRQAAAQLFQTGKAALLNGMPDARKLLDYIIQEVISGKKARGFLLLQEHTEHPLIQRLVDDRILHIIKRGYSSKYDPGERFDVIQLDYGCYVQLLNTNSAPQMLLGDESPDDDLIFGSIFANVEVPEDDYRAIRKAVLNLPTVLETAGFKQDGKSILV